jgi:hypothetical protein
MSEARRPGGPADLLVLLEAVFEVPTGPFIGRSEAQRRVIDAVKEKGLHGERIFLSDQLVRRGALFDASGARVAFPEGEAYEHCFVALVDPTPEARWGHPAYFAFLPADADGDAPTTLCETQLPEHTGSSVRLLPLP